jgi:hypothetical protein
MYSLCILYLLPYQRTSQIFAGISQIGCKNQDSQKNIQKKNSRKILWKFFWGDFLKKKFFYENAERNVAFRE